MAKRFTDTDKWKKPFFRGLDAPYKALWLYILDDCDIAGIWIVDFEIAKIRVGQVDEETALKKFEGHVKAFDGGRKWFIRDFTDFQYGELRETNRMHLAVIQILQKNKLGASEGLPSPQGQGQGQGNGKGEGQGQREISLSDFQNLFDSLWRDRISSMTVHKGKNLDEAIQKAYLHLQAGGRLLNGDAQSFKQCVQAFLNNEKPGGNGKAPRKKAFEI